MLYLYQQQSLDNHYKTLFIRNNKTQIQPTAEFTNIFNL